MKILANSKSVIVTTDKGVKAYEIKVQGDDLEVRLVQPYMNDKGVHVGASLQIEPVVANVIVVRAAPLPAD